MGYFDAYRHLPSWRPWLYALLAAAGLALILIDLLWKGAQYMTVAFFAVLIPMILLRPGGVRGPRSRG